MAPSSRPGEAPSSGHMSISAALSQSKWPILQPPLDVSGWAWTCQKTPGHPCMIISHQLRKSWQCKMLPKMGIGSESLECFWGFVPSCAALQALFPAHNMSRAPLLAQVAVHIACDFLSHACVNSVSPWYFWCAQHDAFDGAQWGPLNMSTFDIKT